MKVGIITLSASDNCGSLLQTYALQRIIENNGYEVEVINFITDISEKMYRIFHPSYIKHPTMMLGTFFRYRTLLEQKKEYQSFRDKFLLYTQEKYDSERALSEIDGVYDYIVCGSDQIWNVYMHDFDNAFLLSWCQKTKKISYAASLGDQKKGKLTDLVKRGFNPENFNAISLRETSAVEKFKTELNLNVELCLDPTLLLEKNEWKELTNTRDIPLEEYIFYYSYNYGDDIKNRIVQKFSQKFNLPVYVINASKWINGKEKRYGFKIYKNAGPIAFLNLMYGCKYSLVESFHGTVFSYIFKKQFWFLKNTNDSVLDDRINDLLSIIGMKDRIMNSGECISKEYSVIDYETETDRFNYLKKVSVNYLKDNLSGR